MQLLLVLLLLLDLILSQFVTFLLRKKSSA